MQPEMYEIENIRSAEQKNWIIQKIGPFIVKFAIDQERTIKPMIEMGGIGPSIARAQFGFDSGVRPARRIVGLDDLLEAAFNVIAAGLDGIDSVLTKANSKTTGGWFGSTVKPFSRPTFEILDEVLPERSIGVTVVVVLGYLITNIIVDLDYRRMY